jgi:hypothetical protein
MQSCQNKKLSKVTSNWLLIDIDVKFVTHVSVHLCDQFDEVQKG